MSRRINYLVLIFTAASALAVPVPTSQTALVKREIPVGALGDLFRNAAVDVGEDLERAVGGDLPNVGEDIDNLAGGGGDDFLVADEPLSEGDGFIEDNLMPNEMDDYHWRLDNLQMSDPELYADIQRGVQRIRSGARTFADLEDWEKDIINRYTGTGMVPQRALLPTSSPQVLASAYEYARVGSATGIRPPLNPVK